MSRFQSTDIIEEDAADLQFPKDALNVEQDTPEPTPEHCAVCLTPFDNIPKIICLCNTLICPLCFSLGLETKSHSNSHSYRVDCSHIPLNGSWTPSEDLKLLNALLDCGYGNWFDIGKKINKEGLKERADELLGFDSCPLQGCFEVLPRPLVPFTSTAISEEPPRFPTNSHLGRQFGGYNAPRGEFQVEFDNEAEAVLAGLESEDDDDEDDLTAKLHAIFVHHYNDRLRERWRRKRILREHGLLLKRTRLLLTKVDARFYHFMQFLTMDDFEKLICGMSRENYLDSELRRLKRYRELGLTRLRLCRLFEKQQSVRELGHRSMNMKFGFLPTLKKKEPMPLDVSQFPRYEMLNDAEKDFCARVRILPEAFLKYKEILVNEGRKNKGLMLKEARSLLKIDVNKTRKLYNFLIERGDLVAKNHGNSM